MSQSLFDTHEVEQGSCASCFHGAELQPGTLQVGVAHFQRSFILISQVVLITKHKGRPEPALLMHALARAPKTPFKAIEEGVYFYNFYI